MARYLVTISGSNREAMLDLARKYRVSVLRSTTRQRDLAGAFAVDALIEDIQIGLLESKGYRVEILEDVDEAAKARLAAFDTGDGYYDVAGIESALESLANLHPATVQRFVLPHTTWEGRICHALKIASGPGSGRVAVYFIAGLHAREWVPPDSLVYFSQQLVHAYSVNSGLTLGGKTFTAAQIQDIVNKLDIIVFPQANPDGRHHSQTVDTMWRKNRRPGPAGSPYCMGVDINRNFDFLWDFPDYFDPDSGVSNSTDPCEYEVYIGPGAASEPETQNVMSVLDNYPNIRFFVDVHSYSGKVMYNWGDDQNQSADPTENFLNPSYDLKRGMKNDAAYREYIANRELGLEVSLANEIGAGIQGVRGKVYQVQSSFDLYPTAGTSTDYVYSRTSLDPAKSRVYSFCIECGQYTFQPSGVERGWIVQEVTAGLLQFCLGILAAPGDIYVRDNLRDSGEEPLPGGGISCSPDINHFRQQLADPQAVLGSVAAMARDDLFEDIEVGQPNYLYVRVQNRGVQALGTDVDVYWSLPSTLPTPASWHLLGTLNVGPIAPCEVEVAGPLTWAQGDIPGEGHYCFVTVLGNVQDPKPDLNAIHTPDDFYSLIRQSNNVTWKNFDVKNMFAGSMQRFDFRIQGWPRQAYAGDLEIDVSELPTNTTVELRLVKRLTQGTVVQNLAVCKDTENYVQYRVTSPDLAALRAMPLASSDRTEASIYITIPDEAPDGAYGFAVLQKIGGKEMGRIMKRIVVGNHPFVANRNSGEVHAANCDWVNRMSPHNKVAYTQVELAVKHGFNGCRFCLPAYDNG